MTDLIIFIWFLGWLVSFGTIMDDVENEATWYVFASILGLVLVWPVWLGKVLRN